MKAEKMFFVVVILILLLKHFKTRKLTFLEGDQQLILDFVLQSFQ